MHKAVSADRMANLEKAMSCDDEVRRVMKWYLASRPDLKRLAMRAGGFSEVVQEACLGLHLSPPVNADCSWVTVVCNATRWAALRLLRQRSKSVRTDAQGISREHEPAYMVDISRGLIASEASQLVSTALKSIDARVAGIVSDRLAGATYEECSKKHRVSKVRIRQLEARGHRMLWQKLKHIEAYSGLHFTNEELAADNPTFVGGPFDGKKHSKKFSVMGFAYQHCQMWAGYRFKSKEDKRLYFTGIASTKYKAVRLPIVPRKKRKVDDDGSGADTGNHLP